MTKERLALLWRKYKVDFGSNWNQIFYGQNAYVNRFWKHFDDEEKRRMMTAAVVKGARTLADFLPLFEWSKNAYYVEPHTGDVACIWEWGSLEELVEVKLTAEGDWVRL